MSAPRVSVLMPVLNGERYLDEAVQSILGQTLADFEFIVLDDGSTDGTWARLAEYAARDPRLRLERSAETLGVCRTLNRGLALARGAYLARQDADDRSHPERLARQAAFLDAHPEVGLLGALVQVIDAAGAPQDARVFAEATDDEALRRLLLETCPFCHGSVMARRSSLAAAGFYDESMEEAEDYELWLRLAEVTRLANLPERLYEFRYYADSVSSRRRPKVMRYMAVALERAVRRRYGTGAAPEHLAPAARAYLRAAIAAFSFDDMEQARGCLARTLELQPAALYSDAHLAEALAPYTGRMPVEAGLAFVQALFARLLPADRRLARLQARLLARLHMREVFAGAERGDWPRVRAHLRPGVRHDPAWLANRGVLSLLAQTLRRRTGQAR